MGNCMDHQRGASWVEEDDDGESAEPESPRHCNRKGKDREVAGDEKMLLGAKGGDVDPSTVVKVKITKKQLEELLLQADLTGLPIQLVLAELMSLGHAAGPRDRGRNWRPALGSIPEVSE